MTIYPGVLNVILNINNLLAVSQNGRGQDKKDK